MERFTIEETATSSKSLLKPEQSVFLLPQVGIYQPYTQFNSEDFELTSDELRAKGYPEWLVERHVQMEAGTGTFLKSQEGKQGPGIHYRNFAAPEETLQSMAWQAVIGLRAQLPPQVRLNGREKTGLVLANFTSPLSGEIAAPSATRPDEAKQQKLLERIAQENHLEALTVVNEACAGFIGAVLKSAEILESDSSIQQIVIVAVEKFSDILNFADRNTALLFGDFATASMMTRARISGTMKLLGGYKEHRHSEADIAALGIGENGKFYMDGPTTFKAAVSGMPQAVTTLADKLDITDIETVLTHQANERIISGVADRLGRSFPGIKAPMFIEGANTSACTIPRLMNALSDPELKQRIAQKAGCTPEELNSPVGRCVAMTAIGAGIHLNSALFRKV